MGIFAEITEHFINIDKAVIEAIWNDWKNDLDWEVGDWIDLRAAEDTCIKAGEYKMIPLGIAMELPKGYEAIIAPRSSTFGKYGVMLGNSIGIIDESYKGDNDEWHFIAYAVRDTIIIKNDRICQFRIIKHQPKVKIVEVDSLGNADRGGIGSTGRS